MAETTSRQSTKAIGEVAFASVIVAAIWAILPTWRAGAQGGSMVSTWPALFGLVIPLAILAVFLARAAVAALAATVPERETRNIWVASVGLTIIVVAVVLAGFGSVLSSVTHHRGLGGTTFAIVGFAVVAIVALVMVRLASLARRWLSAPAVSTISVIAVGAVGTMLWVAVRGADGPSKGLVYAVADALILAVLSLVASRLRAPSSAAKLVTPIAAGLVVLGVVAGVLTAKGVANAGENVRSSVRMLSPVLDLFADPGARPTRGPTPSGVSSGAPSSVAAAASVPAGSASAATRAPRAKPDVLLVTLDSVRADHLGCYGYKRPTSATLDAFAKEAVVFERAYATGPETRSAIAPVLAGRFIESTVRDDREWPTLLRANEMIAETLRGQGYATGAVVSFQWLSKDRGFGQGFEHFDESPFRKAHPERNATSPQAVARAVEAYDALSKKDRPIFLWLHLFDPHTRYLKHEKIDFGSGSMDLYDGEIAFMDHELKRFIDHVKGAGRSGKTAWIIHGSHGEAFNEHGFSGHPPKMYEELVKVPLMMRTPTSKAGRSKVLVSAIDIVPTILDLVSSVPRKLPGRSLTPVLKDPQGAKIDRDGILVSHAGLHKTEPVRAWVRPTKKLVVYGSGRREKRSFFDLSSDPGESTNLAGERGDQLEEMGKVLKVFLAEHVPEVPPSSDR